MHVHLDVVATRVQRHQLMSQHEGAGVVEGAAGEVGSLVQPRPGHLPRQPRPQGVGHLLAVQAAVAAEGKELHELRGLAAHPGVGSDGHPVADDPEAAEQPHLNAHPGTPPAAPWSPRGGCDATNLGALLSAVIRTSPGRPRSRRASR